MSDEIPGIRTHYPRLALRRVRALPGGKGNEIRERVGADHLAALRDAAGEGWVPLSAFLALCEAIHAALGEDGARGFWTDLMRDSYDNGILKPLTTLSNFAAGGSPVSLLLRTAPQAWSLSTRGCGDIEVVERAEDRRFTLQGVDLVPDIVRSRGFTCVFHGACQAMLEVFKARARLETVERPPDHEDRPQLAFAIVLAD